MVDKIELKEFATDLDERIALLEKLKADTVESVDKRLSDFFSSIDSRVVLADEEGILALNLLFSKLNRVGRSKARRLKLVYNAPKVIFKKEQGKKVRIRILMADSGTTTKEAPKAIKETGTIRVLLRETESPTSSVRGMGLEIEKKFGRRETIYRSVERAAAWLEDITGKHIPLPKVIIQESMESAMKAVMEGDMGYRKICLAGVFDMKVPDQIRVSAYQYPKRDLPGMAAHEFSHYAQGRFTNSDRQKEEFYYGDEKLKGVPVRELPPLGNYFHSDMANSYLNECSAIFFAAAFEMREFEGDKEFRQNRFTMAHLILDRMSSPYGSSRKEVIGYAKQFHSEIDRDISHKQLETQLEDASSILNSRKIRGNEKTLEDLKALDRKMKRLADRSDRETVYGVRAPAIAMIIYAKNDFNLEATVAELTSKNQVELLMGIKETPRHALDALDRLI